MICSSMGVRSTTSQMSPERQKFDTEKNRLAGEVFKIALSWINDASHKVKLNDPMDREETFRYLRVNEKRNEQFYFDIDGNKLMENRLENLDEVIESLDETVTAAYKFYFNRLVSDYNKLQMYGKILKDVEDLTDLKDSSILKTAALGLLEGCISEVEVNAHMLDDDKLQWWK